MNPEMIIEQLGLQKHPEGGWFSEIYRSNEIIQKASLPARYSDDHCFSTSIYFLLKSGEISMFHRLKSDEIWHFYSGSPILLISINKNRQLQEAILGSNIEKGELMQYVFSAGSWFAAKPIKENSYSLIGCTVAPGFEYQDFELADRASLIKEYPMYEKIIKEFT